MMHVSLTFECVCACVCQCTHTLMHTPQIVHMHCVFLVVKFGKLAPDQLQGLHL